MIRDKTNAKILRLRLITTAIYLAAAILCFLAVAPMIADAFKPKLKVYYPLSPPKEVVRKAITGMDLNLATKEDLVTLPGIGPKTADAIIQFRQLHPRFNYVEDLAMVKGIGSKKLNDLLPLLHVKDIGEVHEIEAAIE